jgi:GNAT superfamily N-acetyltransferase
LDCSFETDRIYTLDVQERLSHGSTHPFPPRDSPRLSLTLQECFIDPPFYKNLGENNFSQDEIEVKVRLAQGGFVAIADSQIAGAVLLHVEPERLVARISLNVVGRQFRRYGIGSLLLRCAADWAREQGCWAIFLETQQNNYPAIQFYLRNGLQIWSLDPHFYPPGPTEHEVAIFMGKRLRPD